MTDALITALSQRSGLRVVVPALDDGLQGATRRDSGHRGRARGRVDRAGIDRENRPGGADHGQLVECGTDENRWAHSYTRPARKILSIESEVAALIAVAVEAAVKSSLAQRVNITELTQPKRVAVSAALMTVPVQQH